MSERADHWNQVYGTKAATEVSWFEAAPDRSLGWVRDATADRAGAVIDIGGGLSRLGAALAAEGFADVTVLDVSATAVAASVAREPALQGIVADITRWSPLRRYGVWHDRAVLHFLTVEQDRAAYRNALLQGLEPGGQAIIATFAPDGPEKCSGLPVRRYGRDDLTAFLGADFIELASEDFDHHTPSGSAQRFHVGRYQRV